MVLDLELVKHLTDGLIDDIHDRLWLMIEGRRGGQNDASHFRDGRHVPQVTEMKRSFAWNDDEFATLLEGDVCRAGQEIIAE